MNRHPFVAGGVSDHALLSAYQQLHKTLRLRPLLAAVRNLVLETARAEAVSVVVWNEGNSQLDFLLLYNEIPEPRQRPSLAPGVGIYGWVVTNDDSVLIEDVGRDSRYREGLDREIGFTARSLMGVPLHRAGIVYGALIALNRIDGTFLAEDLARLQDLSEPISVALDNALTFQLARRERAQNEALYRVGLALSGQVDLEGVIETLFAQLHKVVPYDAAALYLVRQESGNLEWFRHFGYAGATEDQIQLKVGQGAVGWAADHGEALVIRDVQRDSRYIAARPETRSEMVVPIVSEGEILGVLNLEADAVGHFTASDLRVVRAFANQAGISIARARLVQEREVKKRLQSELNLARNIQLKFLPDSAPSIPGYDVWGWNRPSLEVSGDAYDFIDLGPGQTGLLIADVAGKGVSAALILATLRAAFRSEARAEFSIAEIVSRVNSLVAESVDPGQFATAFYGVLDWDEGRFSYVNAGHDPPLLIRADGSMERLEQGGLLLGMLPDANYDLGSVDLSVGDALLLYTDGVTEAGDPESEPYGEARLEERLRANRARPAREIVEGVLRAVDDFLEGRPVGDDITLVALARR